MPTMDKLSPYATTIAACGDLTVITYHSTQIVAFDRHNITLRTGGWDSVTTRRKMNQAAIHFDLPFRVYRKDGCSLVQRLTDGGEMPLDREVTIRRRS